MVLRVEVTRSFASEALYMAKSPIEDNGALDRTRTCIPGRDAVAGIVTSPKRDFGEIGRDPALTTLSARSRPLSADYELFA